MSTNPPIFATNPTGHLGRPAEDTIFIFGRRAGSPLTPNIAGVYATVQARLIVDNRHLPDDRATARYLFNMGGDYWLNLTAGWDNLRTNRGIAIGRFKYVTGEWQAFNMTTLTEDEIRRNPPPIE